MEIGSKEWEEWLDERLNRPPINPFENMMMGEEMRKDVDRVLNEYIDQHRLTIINPNLKAK